MTGCWRMWSARAVAGCARWCLHLRSTSGAHFSRRAEHRRAVASHRACRDQSSLAGVRREWQRSAYFKHVPFKGSGEPMRRHSPPPGTQPQRRGSDILSDGDASPPAPPYNGRGAPWRTATTTDGSTSNGRGV